jgi:hypothetical protein
MLPDPPAVPPMGHSIDVVFKLDGGRYRTHRQRLQGALHRHRLKTRWWTLRDPPAAPPRGLPLTSSSTSVVDVAGPTGRAPPRGPAINVIFKLGGERCRTCWQCLRGGPPLMLSSTSAVDTTGPTDSASQGAHHRRCLQTQWWTLPDLSAAPPRGAAIDIIFNLGGGHCWTHRQCAPRDRHRHLAATGSRCQYPLPMPPRGPLVD